MTMHISHNPGSWTLSERTLWLSIASLAVALTMELLTSGAVWYAAVAGLPSSPSGRSLGSRPAKCASEVLRSRTARLGKPAAVFVSIGWVASACGGGGSDQAESTSTPESTSTAMSQTTTISTTVTASSPESETTTTQQILVFFSSGDGTDCGLVAPHSRSVPSQDDPIEGAFAALVGGPTEPEQAEGASSFFSTATVSSLKSAVLVDGLLIVDFHDFRAALTNASTSCGSAALLGQLNATAFQFPMVERVRYEIEGSCNTFFNWLQRECASVERDSVTEPDSLATTADAADGSGCNPGTDVLPAGRWFGFLEEVTETDLGFDLACWFSGAAAATAAAEDAVESPPPNDYHVRNESQSVRTLSVSEATTVSWLPSPGDPSTATATVTSYQIWLEERPSRSFQPGVWITIDDTGQVIEIAEQYTP